MAQSVVYADLKFATGPPSTTPEEDDNPYENVLPGSVPAAPSPGGNSEAATADGDAPAQGAHKVVAGGPRCGSREFLSLAERSPRRWHIPTGLLAASLILLLLLLVAIVALGTCYWQITRNLQDASRDHAAEQGRLSQELSAREQSLEQTELELAWARAELQRAWREGNISQLELERLSAELGHVQGVLGKTEKEMQEVQGKLNNSESTVSSLRACVNTDCCPSGWVLYRSKCLFISVDKVSWEKSNHDCNKKAAQLLTQDDWSPLTVPHFVWESSTKYWIGRGPFYGKWGTSGWQDSMNGNCRTISNGKISSSICWSSFQWICKKPPKLSSTSETQPLFPAKD